MTVRVLCTLLLLGLAAPAQERSPLNQKMPEWLALGAEGRVRAEGLRGNGYRAGNDSDILLERLRFQLGLKPLSWLRFFGEVQDARAAGVPVLTGSVKNSFDIRRAWVELGKEGGTVSLRVGRQKIFYGTERLIGGAEWGNTARVFDAAKLTFRRNADFADVFAASVVVNDADAWDHHRQGNNLHGIYGHVESWIPGTAVEPFVLYRTNHQARANSWTGGVRAAGALGPLWNYEADIIRQRGSVPGLELHAWSAMAHVDRHFPDTRWRPALYAEINFASGDRNPADDVVNTFDQLYPTNHGIYGYTDQVGRRNTRNIRGGVAFKPARWLNLRTEAHSFWLASRFDGLYAAGGSLALAAPQGGAASTHVGQEFDVAADISFARHYSAGFQYGYFVPGDFVRSQSPGHATAFYAVWLGFRH